MRSLFFKPFLGHQLGRMWIFRKLIELTIRILNPIKVGEHKMYVIPRDDALDLLFNDNYEPEVVKRIKWFIKPGDTVIDIGANIGYHTMIMAKLVGARGKVIALEPDSKNFVYLGENIMLNGYINTTTAFKLAVSDNGNGSQLYLVPGKGSGRQQTYDSGEGRESVNINTTKIDDLYFKDGRVDFIKMDVEGSEFMALRGMKETIKNNPNLKMIMEYLPDYLRRNGKNPEEILDTLREYGLRWTRIDKNNLLVEK